MGTRGHGRQRDATLVRKMVIYLHFWLFPRAAHRWRGMVGVGPAGGGGCVKMASYSFPPSWMVVGAGNYIWADHSVVTSGHYRSHRGHEAAARTPPSPRVDERKETFK